MKIPTLLAFLILFFLAIGGFAYQLYSQKSQQDIVQMYQPRDIHILPISDSSAIITWETEATASGSIKLSTSSSFDSILAPLQKVKVFQGIDQRDTSTKGYRTHLIQLTNLSPNTTYYFKMQSGNTTYPSSSLTVQTMTTATQSAVWSKEQPLVGSVLDLQNHPVSDALVFLEVNNKPLVATTTTSLGSFVLPLVNLGSLLPNPNQQPITAILLVTDSKQQSHVSLSLPYKNTLEPIILGTDLKLP